MKQTLPILLFICAILSLASCAGRQTPDGGGADAQKPPEQPAGHRLEATVDNNAAGTLIHAIVAGQMDAYDRQQLNHVYDRGVSGSPAAWINPDNGNLYSVTPGTASADPMSTQFCRRAGIAVLIGGREQTTESTACRMENGQWQLR